MKNLRPILAMVLAVNGLSGCARQNPRTVSHVDTDASIPLNLPWQPEDGRVITTWVDTKHSTMSTLYGNDIAVNSARSSVGGPAYPIGARIALVTWREREDERWFGASIPATVQSVEFVTIRSGPTNKVEYVCLRFEGGLLQHTLADTPIASRDRAAYLLSQRAAIMP
jgi:hypothetical protein